MNSRLDTRGRAQKNLTAMLELRAPTPAQWLPVVLGDFDALLPLRAAVH